MRDIYRDDDQVQADTLATQYMDQQERKAERRLVKAQRREERRQDRILLVEHVMAFAVIYGIAACVVGAVFSAWRATGDGRFGWALGVLVLAVIVGHMACLDRGGRR